MEPLNVECDLQSLRRLYNLLLLQSNANKEYVPQAFLLDENSQFLLKRLLDSATGELLARQHKVLAQAQLSLPERRVTTPSTTKVNSVSGGIVKLPSKAALTHEVVDSIERIETQLSAFQFCSTRGEKTRSCKPPMEEEEGYSSSGMPFQRLNEKALIEPRQSYLRSRQMSQKTSRTSSVAPSLRSVNNNNNATVRSRYDDQIVLVKQSRPPLPPRPLRSVGFEKPGRTSQKMESMKPTLLLDQGTETGTSSESEEQVYSTEQESDEASGETVSTSGSSWETHAESVTGSDSSSYPSESDDGDGDGDENSQASDSPPRNRSRGPAKQRKKRTGRLKRFKDKLGKVFHHHHYHHHEHHNKDGEQGRKKPSAWKHLVKKHLQKDKEKLVEKRMKTESKGVATTHNNKGGQFHALVKGFVRHHRSHSKNKNQKLQTTPKRHGVVVKLPKRERVKLEKTNYLCNKYQEHDETKS
ncbi:protein KOKOPELLI [Raphanus sativus]|uniref:Protein KOKOPELLI n=1 Tax=Raphanus sativus TaxID=3726 RepID=A0A9W3BRI6_RAPSA|nr:protein KOKOPELLI [Raphanus sativus]